MPRSKKKRFALKPPPKTPTLSTLKFSGESLIESEIDLMVQSGRRSAKRHGINLLNGTRNSADGNCAFESVLSNVNERACFTEKYPLSHGFYRRIWVTDMKNRTSDDNTFKIYSNREWEEGWDELLETGVYERGLFGDLMLFGISCGIKKILLIFNTNLNSPHDPIYVCDPRKFGVEPDTDIPVVLAYNLVHYEGLIPLDESDEAKTVQLVKQYQDGNYSFSKQDLPFLLCSETKEEMESIENERKETVPKSTIPQQNQKRSNSKEFDMEDPAKKLRDNEKSDSGYTEVDYKNQEAEKTNNKEKIRLRRQKNRENM